MLIASALLFLYVQKLLLHLNFSLFHNKEWESIRAVGGLATLYLPDVCFSTLQSLITFITVGEVIMPSTMVSEFMILASMLQIENFTGQVIVLYKP